MKQRTPGIRRRIRYTALMLAGVLPLAAIAWHAAPTIDSGPAAPAGPHVTPPGPGVWVPSADMFARESMPVFCFAPGTDPAVMAYYNELMQYDPYTDYYLGTRWSGSQGDPITLRWSLVPDGLSIDDGVPSDLFSSMDAKFGGNRALWISKIQACFDRWEVLTGISYQRITYGGNDWDDGASWGSSGSSTRGDVRIAAKNIDGQSGVLAYNYYPGSGIGGEMVLDSSESWGSSSNDYRFLRNVVMHEHGHGIGLAHCCPSNNTKLMEPYLSTSFDGPQHDDIRGAQRHYGDPFEADNSTAVANDLGTITFGQPVTIGPVPSPQVAYGSILSIDANGEVDWFKFTVTDDATASVTVTPIGTYYDSSSQNSDGSCNSDNFIDSLALADLNVQLIGQNGSTVIATAASEPVGGIEQLSYVHLPSGPGTYYIKVYEGNTPNQTQLYHLTVETNLYDPYPPTPDPMTFATPPYPTSTTVIAMVATTASDAQSPPIYYYYDFVSGGPGGTPGYWRTSTSYSDGGLQPNTAYTYAVRARDSATPWNETAPSAPATTATFIETPSGTVIGEVTSHSIQISATGNLTNLAEGNSGLYFDCLGPNCDGGLNQWVQVNSATAVDIPPNTYCMFRVKARNRNGVETIWSQFNGSAYTLAEVPAAPTVSNPTAGSLQLNINPNGNPAGTEFAILCSSTPDPAWQGKYVGGTGQSVAQAVWRTQAEWGDLIVEDLQPATTYCFQVMARNAEWIETEFSAPGCGQTSPEGGGLVGDLNCDGVVDFGDINPFVMFLSNYTAWQAAFPGCPATNGDINGDGVYPDFADINPFVALLTSR